MILSAKSGIRGKIIDLDTGQEIRKVIMVNTDSGYFEAYQLDEQGEIRTDDLGNYLTYSGVARVKVIPREGYGTGSRIVMGAPRCTLCQSSLTLPGDDLCPICRAFHRRQKGFYRQDILRFPFLIGCHHENCTRLASHMVSDEVEVTPALGEKIERNGLKGCYIYERGCVVNRRYYCEFHYQPPRLLDPKGEVITEFQEEPNRPG